MDVTPESCRQAASADHRNPDLVRQHREWRSLPLGGGGVPTEVCPRSSRLLH